MRFQSTSASCGPAALRNALLARGIKRSEDELAALASCDSEGTTAKGMMRALIAIAKDNSHVLPAPFMESREDIAFIKLVNALQNGHVVIMCVDGFEHWVCAFGLLGRNVVHVADSGDAELVHHYDPVALCQRWKGLGRKPYYGIIV